MEPGFKVGLFFCPVPLEEGGLFILPGDLQWPAHHHLTSRWSPPSLLLSHSELVLDLWSLAGRLEMEMARPDWFNQGIGQRCRFDIMTISVHGIGLPDSCHLSNRTY